MERTGKPETEQLAGFTSFVEEQLKSGEKTAVLFFEDDGIPYNPPENPEPDLNAPPEERKAGGLGIYLVKNGWTGSHTAIIMGETDLR